MKVSVFTPVYNRAEIIVELYNSLLRQTSCDFEWIVVDDGSSDHIDLVMKKILDDDTRLFSVIYRKQKNGGKHTAVNHGVNNANGEYFIIVDSDDYLVDNAIETIIKEFENCPPNYAGLGFLKITKNGSLIGKTFKGHNFDALSSERQRYGIYGDKAEVFYTDVMRRYPFRVFKNERFITENSVWYKMSYDGLKIRWINTPIMVCEYLPGGLSDNAEKLKINNFEGLTYSVNVILSCDIYWLERLKTVGNYVQIARKKKIKYRDISKRISVGMTEILFSYSLCIAKKKIKKKYVEFTMKQK